MMSQESAFTSLTSSLVMKQPILITTVALLISACGGSGSSIAVTTAPGSACIQSTVAPTAEVSATQTLFQVKPSAASSCITGIDNPHQVYIDSAATPKELLAIFLPGTGGMPEQFPAFLKRGAARGYHTIGLSYINPQSVSDICDAVDGDTNCTGLLREESLSGKDASSLISISSADGIEARLVALLKYLAFHRPNDGWGQYLDGQNAIRWEKVSVSGNSQGAGHASYIGKVRKVYRVGMYAGPSDWVKKTNQAPAWFSLASQTPSSAFFGYNHIPDSLANRSGDPDQVTKVWGTSSFFNMQGTVINTAGGAALSTPPFGGSQRLSTTACVTLDTTNQHNCPMFNGNQVAWDYISFP
jgi:hypothetical protein